MRFLCLLVILVLSGSCAVTEKNITGTYRLRQQSRTLLRLEVDKSFEFVKNFTQPGPLFYPDSTEFNFRSSGSWLLENGQLVLNSSPASLSPAGVAAIDSVIYHTDITTFSFWDRYGDPVSIRLLHFPESRVKLHKGNLVSFFAEDFIHTDTLVFHFYGYPPYQWVANPAMKGINSQHRITVFEQARPAFFRDHRLRVLRGKLVAPDGSFTLFRNNEQ